MVNSLSSFLVRRLRKIFPSISELTYSTPVKLALNAIEAPVRFLSGFSTVLPPNYMRVRVGVGWRLFNNAELYLNEPVNLWLCMLARGWINFGSTILDIGTGCGRFAHVLRDYRFAGGQFTGTYIGVDVDAEMLDWCRQNFPAEHFRYHLSPHQARTYGRPDAHAEAYRIPEADGSIDFVFSTSLFTHLLESELKNYVEEAARLLRPGGWMAGQCFVMERPPPTYGARHTFQHRIGNAMVESLARPEAAVAYHEAFLIETLHQAGFSNVSIQSSPGDWQCLLAGQKPPQA